MNRFYYLPILAFLFLLSNCKGKDSTKEKANDKDSSKPIIESDNLYNSGIDVYSSYLPPLFRAYLTDYFKEWNIPKQSNWDSSWWKEYKKDSSLVDYIPGDFNCDGKKDYALILENNKGNLAAWAFIARNDSFTPMMLEQVPKDSGHINIGLEPLETGNTGYFQGEKPMTKKITCAGVTLNFFEQAAHSFYWEKGKMKTIQTAD